MPSFSHLATLTLAVSAYANPLKWVPKHAQDCNSTMVPGKAFDRIAIIWLENTDYDKAIGDPNLAWLASKGITLSSYHGVTHPSEPNYVANFGGDYFGMNNDDLNKLDANVSCLADLLEAKGISWGEYQEDMPYTGYQGYQYLNKKGANDYVRKHNPAVIYNSVAEKEERLSKIKNTTLFFEDLENDNLPQWMFITPNMTSDGHDSSVTVAGSWTRNFVEPLLNNTKFMKNTLVLITFDENETYTIQNNVLAILLGDAVPAKYIGTTDSTYYDHYSALSTVEANWDLDTLGRFDVGANVFKMVAEKTGDVVREWTATPALENRYFNYSYAGPFNDISGKDDRPYAAPNTDLVYAGRKVFPEVQQTWAKYANLSYYTTALEIPDGYYPPAGFA